MKILYDGWPLTREPASPAGLHLLALLEHLPEDVQPVIALPHPAPPGIPDYSVYPIATPAPDVGRLIWEQCVLPNIARRISAAILHLVVPRAPIQGSACIIRPAEFLAGSAFLMSSLKQLTWGGSLRPLADAPLQFLPWLYQECTAIFHPVSAFSPWGGSIHHGLACGKAIMSAETAQ